MLLLYFDVTPCKKYAIQHKVFGTKLKNSIKIRQHWKSLASIFTYFWIANFKFSKGDSTLGFIQVWSFSNISQFPQIVSLTLFGNLWDNSYTRTLILEIKFRFNCGDLDLYYRFSHSVIIKKVLHFHGLNIILKCMLRLLFSFNPSLWLCKNRAAGITCVLFQTFLSILIPGKFIYFQSSRSITGLIFPTICELFPIFL